MWRELLASFQVEGEIVSPSIASTEFNRYERELGTPLPQSYKAFCSTFGPGDIVTPFQYTISAPGPEDWTSLFEIRRLNRYAQEAYYETEQYIEDPLDASRLSTALFFGTDLGTYFYFWNLAEVTSSLEMEYAVYVIRRDDTIIRLCDTFSDFIIKICLRDGVPGEDPSVERERTFTPPSDLGTQLGSR